MPVITGKKYCKFHEPVKTNKVTITTYAIKNYFDGNQSVKAIDYKEYLKSKEWQEKSIKEKEKNPNCSLCNGKGKLHTHHRTYVRCGNERDGDLIVLCSECHDLFHKFYEYDGMVGYFKKRK